MAIRRRMILVQSTLLSLLFLSIPHFTSHVEAGLSKEVERRFNVSESAAVGERLGNVLDSKPAEWDPKNENFLVVYPDATPRGGEKAAGQPLDLNPMTGEITIRSALDHENQSRLTALAVPIDPSLSPIRVIVEVLDENDNAPAFPNESITIQLSEYARMVERYRLLAAGNVNNAFRLASQRFNGQLLLDLLVNGKLDREYRERYHLVIEALDGGMPPRTGRLNVEVEILDANDNIPEFLQTHYEAHIPDGESVPVGYPVVKLKAKDADKGENARITYRFTKALTSPNTTRSQGSVPLPFEVDPDSGTVIVSRSPLPRDVVLWEVWVAASDHGKPHALESIVLLSITVGGDQSGMDIADQASHQHQHYLNVAWLTDDASERAEENLPVGYVLARIAIDGTMKESVQAHRLSLHGSGESILCLKETDSPLVYLMIVCGYLDRETQGDFLSVNLVLRNRHDEVLLDHPLHLTLLDVNDNAPRWNQSVFHLQWRWHRLKIMDEHQYRLLATDADEGENGRIHYSIVNPSSTSGNKSTTLAPPFKIDRELGILSMMPLVDYSTHLAESSKACSPPSPSSYRFQVLAEDNGRPERLHSIADVWLELVDADAPPPRFEKSLYEVKVAEDVDVGTCLVQVSATPSTCVSLPENSSLRYSLHSAHQSFSPFRIDPISGKICLSHALDYERQRSYQLSAHVQDSNNIGKWSSALVSVAVEDVNDEIPRFQPTRYEVNLGVYAGDSTPQRELLRVLAVDADASESFSAIRYSLVNNDSVAFRIDPITGQIFQNGPVEVQNASFELRVETKDTGGLASHDPAIVTIHPYRVENAEKCPKFSSPLYEFEVQEDLLPGIQVGPQLELVNGHQLDFNMSIEGADDRFLLDERHFGRLLLARELDADGPDGNSILLNLRLHSSSHEANGHRSTKSCLQNDYAQVLIHLADINDNAPRFSLPRMDVQVAENYPIHQALYVVKAEDADRGEENSLVGYELLESEPVGCPVQIHPTTGELSLAAPLDYEHKTHYTLTVRARDHGLPPRHSTARLELNVIDVNDNAPQFPQSHYQLTVSEDASMMAKLASVKAEDADSGENGFVNYRLVGDEAIKELFTIDPLKGELLLRGQLDREKRDSYSFVAVASDFGSPRLSSNATIHVQVTDVNDNTPQCAGNGTQMAFNLSGTAMNGHGKIPRSDLFGLVGIVKALDLDEGENGSLIYRLQTPSTLFELKPKGELVLKKRLSSAPSSSNNHPTTVIYRLSVVVEDQGRPYHLSTVCQVTVRVNLHAVNGGETDKSGHQLTSLNPLRSSKRRPPGLERPIVVELRPGLEVWKAGQVLFDGFRPSKGHYYKLVDENWATATSPFGLDEVTGAVYLADPIKLLVRKAENAGKEASFNHSLLIERHSMLDSNATEAVNTTTVQFIGQAEAVDGVGGGLWPPLMGGFAPMLRDYHVSEEMGIGTVIGRVTLKARDGIESFNNEISPTTEPDSNNPISRVRFRLLETFSSTNQFTVDERTAELSIQRVLQSHLIPVHHLVVQAYIAAENSSNNNPIEKTEGYRTANCVVRVYVHGVNDHSPEWLSTANRTLPLDWLQRLPALNAEPVIIHHFVANDADMGDYVDEGEKVEWRRLTYEMASKAKAKEAGLELNAKTGALSVVDKRALEKVGGLELELVVKAWDWGSWPNATGRRYTEQHFFLHIIAGTTNDMAPSQTDHHQQQLASSHSTYFPESHYRFTIAAGSSEGAVINNFKRMDWVSSIAGEDDTISFKLFQHDNSLSKPEKGTSKEGASVFEIGAKDGILKVREALAETRYRTIVYAEGRARNRTLWSEHTLVEVAVKSEIPGPKIAQSSCRTISVRENQAIPDLLRVFALQPANESTSRKLHWKLEGLSTGEPLFFIGSTSGQLSCRELDREQKSEHLLVISASYTLIDDTTQPVVKMDVCTVHVRVLDTNDNVPQFISTESSDEVMVANSTRVGDIVGRVRAEDLDEGENGLVRYRMLMPSKAEALESVLEVDAESGLIVFKRDPPSSPISPPAEFTATMIAEDAGHSRILHAEKAIRVTWKRLPSSSFKNHTSSSQRSPLRRRQKLTAIVLENAQKGQLVAQLELPASKALTSKTNNATSAVNFRIVEGNSGQVFEVDQMGRVLVGSPNAENNSHGGALDAETRSVYRLVVVARREQSGPLAEWELTVRILGTNNGWPKFVEIETEMSLPESTPVGTLLWQLKATDPDSDTDLRYTLIGDVTAEKIFHVGYVTGAIHLQQALDFELPPTIHVFAVQVTDGKHSTAMNLTLRVQDVNDNEPSFTGFSVADETAGLGAVVVGSELDQGVGWLELEMGSEALSYGGTIGKFQAMDADSGENGRIEFGVRDPYSLFGIDPDKGTLRSLHRLRRSQIYFFDVFATDHGHPPLSSTVTVKLTTPSSEHASGYSARDSVLRSPGFAQPEQRLSVSESHAPFLSFTRLETKGGRSGANGRECHFFTTTSKFFGVSPLTAELYPLMPLDREIYPDGFTIDVEMRECRSNRTVSKSRTHLKLIDVNEHWPEFHLPARITDPNMSISIGEATPRDTPLAPKFAALDVDDTTDGNGRVTYRILAGDDYAMLKLHPTEGWLVFDHWDERVVWDVQKRALETGDSVSPSISLPTVYSLPLIIAAADNGVPKLVSTLQLTNIAISLSEWRGSAPRFPVIHKSPTRRQSYSTRLLRHFVREDTPPGTILFTGSAVNYAVDVESRRGWKYSLHEIGPVKHFSINETTAEISLLHPLDYENITSHELHLTVEDPTRPSRNSDNTTVVVEVVGVDEHAPVFTKSSYTFQLPYKTPIGYILGRVEAYDEDVGVGSKVEYGMAPLADPGLTGLIAINKETGHLSLRALVHPSFLPLNNQSMVLRQLMVAASSSPAHSNQALVYLEFLGADATTPAISSTPWVHGLFGNLLSLPMLLLSVLLVSTIAMLVYLYKNVRQGKDKAKGGEKQMLRLSPTDNKFDLNRLSPSPTFADKLKMGINASSTTGQFSSQHTDIFSLSVNSNVSRLSQQHQIPLPQSEPILPPRQVQFGDRGESRFVDEYLASLGVTGSPPFKEYSLEELQAELDEEGDRRGVVFARLEDILGPGPVVLAPSALSAVNNSCAETAFNHRCALNTSLVSFTSPPPNPRQPPELGLPTIAEQLNLHQQTLRQKNEDERRRGVARQSRVDELNESVNGDSTCGREEYFL